MKRWKYMKLRLLGMRFRLLAYMAVMVVVAGVTAGIVIRRCAADDDIQKELAEQIIRLHVRADSDSDEAQELKMKVKSSVVAYIEPLLRDSTGIDESRQILNDNIEAIRDNALDTLQDNGCEDDVSVYFENAYFPAKSYGDVTFPPGEYEAFRIDIGKASGRNWWCVLYPPLCFVDASYGVLQDESKQELKNILTEDEYNAITEKQYYRFKYLKFLNFLFE